MFPGSYGLSGLGLIFLQSDGAAVPRLCSQSKATEILILADLGFSSVRFGSFRSGCIRNLLTYLLTPWSRVLLVKLTCFQLVKI